MSNNIKITKEIPAPPEGFIFEDRCPNNGELFIALDGWAEWSKPKTWVGSSAKIDGWVYAYRIKKKRLMTPQELAAGWLVGPLGGRCRVVRFTENHVVVCINQSDILIRTSKELQSIGWLYSDTPTSDPRSLEVDE